MRQRQFVCCTLPLLRPFTSSEHPELGYRMMKRLEIFISYLRKGLVVRLIQSWSLIIFLLVALVIIQKMELNYDFKI